MKNFTTDCLVLGGGLAGWTAARELVRGGCQTILLQDGAGASEWVHGFNAPVHPDDSEGQFLSDTLKSGKGLSDPMLAKALCGDAVKVFEDIKAMGLRFNEDKDGYRLLRPLGASCPRVASIGNQTGAEILKAYKDEFACRVQELPCVRAVRLIKSNGCVCGALCYDTRQNEWMTISARDVVLACGGFCGIFPVTTNKRDSGGDGIGMAYRAGAQLCDMEMIQFEPSAAVWPKELLGTSMITTMLYDGAVLLNRYGERFMLKYGQQGERVGKDVMARCIAAEILAGRGTEHGGVYFDATNVGAQKLDSEYPAYTQRYRAVGIDLSVQKIEIGPAAHTSLGGVRVDDNGQTTVQGLYACGEVMGGLHGANRIGGSAGLETLVFGSRAGRAAAKYAREVPAQTCVEKTPSADGIDISLELNAADAGLRDALNKAAGPVRTGAELTRACAKLSELIAEVSALGGADDKQVYRRIRLENDLNAAMLCCCAALAREETLGCHTRADCPEKPLATYRVVQMMQPDGAFKEWKETVQA